MASGYELRDAQVKALTKALVEVLDELRKSDKARCERTIATLVGNPDVRKTLQAALVNVAIPAKTFSPMAKAIANHSSLGVNRGKGDVSPSELAGRVSKGRG